MQIIMKHESSDLETFSRLVSTQCINKLHWFVLKAAIATTYHQIYDEHQHQLRGKAKAVDMNNLAAFDKPGFRIPRDMATR